LGNGQWNIADLLRLLVEVISKAAAVIDYKVEHVFPARGARTMLVTARALRHLNASSHSMLAVISDATERYRREAAKDTLFAELQHRTKNLLAVAATIARQTTTADRSADENRDDFLGRLRALIAAHEFAFSSKGKAAMARLAGLH
jgi:hypothetical protein